MAPRHRTYQTDHIKIIYLAELALDFASGAALAASSSPRCSRGGAGSQLLAALKRHFTGQHVSRASQRIRGSTWWRSVSRTVSRQITGPNSQIPVNARHPVPGHMLPHAKTGEPCRCLARRLALYDGAPTQTGSSAPNAGLFVSAQGLSPGVRHADPRRFDIRRRCCWSPQQRAPSQANPNPADKAHQPQHSAPFPPAMDTVTRGEDGDLHGPTRRHGVVAEPGS